MKKRCAGILMILVFALLLFGGCTKTTAVSITDYSDKANWAYYAIGEEKPADLFIIALLQADGDEGLRTGSK